jgi:ribosome-binding protein aMBF1 (putative translation factor)
VASISKNVQAAGKRQSGKPKAALSPRGRGSVPPVPDPDRLLRLFGTNLRRVRVARGLSQEALGDLSDIDRTYVSGIERLLRNPSIRNIQRLADALQVDARLLLDPELSKDPRFDATDLRVGATKPLADGFV